MENLSHSLWLEFITVLGVNFLIGVISLGVLLVLSKKLFARSLFKPAFYFWILTLALNAFDILQNDYQFLHEFAPWINPAKKVVTLIFLWWFAYSWPKKYLSALIEKKREADEPREAYEPLIILNKLSKSCVSIIFALLILANLGIQISALLAFGGISGIAISYAAKDILNNILSGVILSITHPFQRGDHIVVKSKGLDGQVVDMGFYYTTIKNPEDSKPVYAPNAIFANTAIKNESK